MKATRGKLDGETAKKFEKRIKYSAQKFGFASRADDISQGVLLKMLEGRHQHSTVDQSVIDYLRENYGSKRLRSYSQRQSFNNAHSYEQDGFDNTLQSNPGRELGAGRDFIDLIVFLGSKDRAVCSLTYVWGFNEIEIGNLFGVSESRVSQWLQSIQKRLSARIKTQAWNERKREGQMEGLLLPETKTNGWQLEQGTFERMEIGESWQVAGFDEASF